MKRSLEGYWPSSSNAADKVAKKRAAPASRKHSARYDSASGKRPITAARKTKAAARFNDGAATAFAQIAMLTQHTASMSGPGTATATPVPLFGKHPVSSGGSQLLILPGVSTSLNITVKDLSSATFTLLAGVSHRRRPRKQLVVQAAAIV